LAPSNSISIHHFNESIDEIVDTLDQKLQDVSAKISLVVFGRNSPKQQGLGKTCSKYSQQGLF